MVSVKHHYLPQYYLKGFTDSKEGFWVYDKQVGKIFRSGSVETFYEKHLNTVTFPKGETSDFLEDAYTDLENQSWNSLDAIRTSTINTDIQLSDKMNFYLFLLFLHWRLPSNIGFVDKLSEVALVENNDTMNFFNITDRNGKQAPEGFLKTVRESSAFKKSVKVLIPFAPFLKDKDWHKNLEKWRFLYSTDDKGWYIVGDNPIITEGHNDHNPINCLQEFIFPISGKILLVNIEPPLVKGIPSETVMQFSIAIIERAKRFVACQDKEYLEILVELYKYYVRFNRTRLIISDFFRMLKN